MKKSAHLISRSLLCLSGSETISFMQNLVTCDVETLRPGQITFGALLTPQGKILFDFLLQKEADGLLVDIDKSQLDALKKRLTFYKLRADVQIEPDERLVYATWDDDSADGACDPRNSALGNRIYATFLETNATEEDWNAHRIFVGIPESGQDFELGSLFPHDALMDQFEVGGVDFSKGCYVGQEVVSRMQHRSTARNRFVKIKSSQHLLAQAGTEIMSLGKKIGTMGSSRGGTGLALVRIDRAAKAIQDGHSILLGDREVSLERPAFAKFDWPV